MTQRLRICLVGCGRVSPKHFESIATHPGLELVGVCDIDDEARETASRRWEVPGYAHMESMLIELQPDLTTLATPSGLHPQQTMLAAHHGSNVITEKPMAIRWKDAERMIDACERAGVKLFVVKQHRFNPAVQRLKKAVEVGQFGRIFSVHLSLFWARPQSYYDMAAWRGTWELDGGALMNQAIHYVDLLRWIIGPVESVHAFTATQARRIEVEDSAAVSMKFRSGALGTMNVSMLTHSKNYEGSITILGERGTARIGGVACNRIEHWEFDENQVDSEDASHDSESVYGIGHPLLYEDVVASLLDSGHDALIEGREGMKALEIVVAAYRSAQEARRISLPLG